MTLYWQKGGSAMITKKIVESWSKEAYDNGGKGLTQTTKAALKYMLRKNKTIEQHMDWLSGVGAKDPYIFPVLKLKEIYGNFNYQEHDADIALDVMKSVYPCYGYRKDSYEDEMRMAALILFINSDTIDSFATDTTTTDEIIDKALELYFSAICEIKSSGYKLIREFQPVDISK